MDLSRNHLTLHPFFLEALFGFKSMTSRIFKDVLGLHDIDHISLARVRANQILILSSSPALEYNLFNSEYWQFDHAFHPSWFEQFQTASWKELYQPEYYDVLYYLKQMKPARPTGIALSINCEEENLIFSFASAKECEKTIQCFSTQQKDFYKIGQYCLLRLQTLFQECDGFLTSESNRIQNTRLGTFNLPWINIR